MPTPKWRGWFEQRLPRRRTAASISAAARNAAAAQYVRIDGELADALLRIIGDAALRGAASNSGVIEVQVQQVGRAVQEKIGARISQERRFRSEARLQLSADEAAALREELRGLVEQDFAAHSGKRPRITVRFDAIRQQALERADMEVRCLLDEDFVGSLPDSLRGLLTAAWRAFGILGVGVAAGALLLAYVLGRLMSCP